MKRSLGLMLALVLVSGCSTLNTEQKVEYDLMKKDGVLVVEKNPTTAAWLGLLPGGGAFYTGTPAIGVIDLLLWWPSAAWDPFVGYHRAKKVNYDATVAILERNKNKHLVLLENQRDRGEINDAEYAVSKRLIIYKNDYSIGGGVATGVDSFDIVESPVYSVAVVEAFVDETAFTSDDADEVASHREKMREAGEQFADIVAQRLRDQKIYDTVLRDASYKGTAARISGSITRYEEGNRAGRYLVGMGVGSSRLDAVVKFTDNVTGNTAGEVVIDKDSWILGGGYAANQTVDGYMDSAAKALADAILEKRRELSAQLAAGAAQAEIQ